MLFSITTESRAYFFFVCTKLLGIRVAPTTYPGIVDVCDYDIPRIVQSWNKLANIKLREKSRTRKCGITS